MSSHALDDTNYFILHLVIIYTRDGNLSKPIIVDVAIMIRIILIKNIAELFLLRKKNVMMEYIS